VKVLVTGSTGLRDPKECLAEILQLDIRALCCWNLFGKMALVAGEPRVLSLQQVTGLFVIELVLIPFDQREICAVVIRMAAHTLLAGTRRDVIRPV
jgi:hypothetical protein